MSWINSEFSHSSFASFTWTDGKLNSSNILILSGPAVAHFDLEFRILYARSKPINLKELPSFQKSKVLDQLLRITVSSRDLTRENFLRMEFLYLRAFVGNLKRKRSWLHTSREAVYVSSNALHASPPLTKRNGSLVMRPHWIIERWIACSLGGEQQNLRSHVQPSLPSTALQHVCERTNLELRGIDTGIVVSFEDHYNADQQTQLWYCLSSDVFQKKPALNTWEAIIDF